MSYESAQTYIQQQGIKTATEFHHWMKTGKRPDDFPSHPQVVYRDQWKGWREFLGIQQMMSYKEAKAFIQTIGIQTVKESLEWSQSDKRPANFPPFPNEFYRDQWISWTEFLGSNRAWEAKGISYEEAQALVQQLGIKTQREFHQWASRGRLDRIPHHPDRIFQDQWEGWRVFLGTDKPKENKMKLPAASRGELNPKRLKGLAQRFETSLVERTLITKPAKNRQ